MGIKKRQHYLPVMYLKGFCNQDGEIWTYDRDDLNKERSPTTADKTAFENKLYDLENVTPGIDVNIIENFFAEKIEGPAGDALKQLREQHFPPSHEREAISLFFALLILRSPTYLEHIDKQFGGDLDKFLKSCARNHDYFHLNYKNAAIEATYEEVEADRLFILEEENNILRLNKNYKLHYILMMGFHISKWLLNMNWALIKTNTDLPFITGDNLLNLYNPQLPNSSIYKGGLLFLNTCLFIPISSYLTLIMVNQPKFNDSQIFNIQERRYDSEGNLVDIKNIVKALNKQTASNSNRFIFYHKKCSRIKRLLQNSK